MLQLVSWAATAAARSTHCTSWYLCACGMRSDAEACAPRPPSPASLTRGSFPFLQAARILAASSAEVPAGAVSRSLRGQAAAAPQQQYVSSGRQQKYGSSSSSSRTAWACAE
jgi:hypothetical protein